MLLELENKFRAGIKLNESERELLVNTIQQSPNYAILQSAIYIYGREFDKNDMVAQKASQFVEINRIPGLAAVCLEVLIDFWNEVDLVGKLERYLSYTCMDEWYDERTAAVKGAPCGVRCEPNRHRC